MKHFHDWRRQEVVVVWEDGSTQTIKYKLCLGCGMVLT